MAGTDTKENCPLDTLCDVNKKRSDKDSRGFHPFPVTPEKDIFSPLICIVI